MNARLVDSVNFYIRNGITIGIAYHWAGFDHGITANEACLEWLAWDACGPRYSLHRPPKTYVDWRKSDLMPTGVDNSNYENGVIA